MGIRRDCAGGQQRQLHIVARRQGNRLIGGRVDNGVYLRSFGFKNGRSARHFNRLAHLANFQRNIYTRDLVQHQSEGRKQRGLKAFLFHAEIVIADRKLRDPVNSHLVGYVFKDCTPLHGLRRNRRSCNRGPG